MYKSHLQEFCHKHSWDLPVYSTVKDGPDHCPSFTTTVTVNGVPFQSPSNEFKSSKESQNMAAKVAFDSFTASAHSPPSPSVPSPLPLSGLRDKLHFAAATNEILQPKQGGNVSADMAAKVAFDSFTASAHSPSSPSVPSPLPLSGLREKLHFAAATNEILQPKQGEILQPNQGGNVLVDMAIDTSLHHGDDSKPKDFIHLYKNRLQHYAQKNNLSLPDYSSEFDGPPHSRRFRAKVTIDGKIYKSPEYYPTLKEAEHAAAKTALDFLSVVEIRENDGLYKTLLQELAQKEGFHFPLYTTIKSGLAHIPTFVSSVEVGGKIYQGEECKTKKQSEMNAAKVAYNRLIERTKVSPVSKSLKNVETPVSLQPINGDNCEQISAKITQGNHMKRAAGELDGNANIISLGSHVKEPSKMPSSNLGYVVTNDSQQNIQPKHAHAVQESLDSGVEGNEKDAKRHRLSSSQNTCHHFPEALSPSCAQSNAASSCSMPSELVKSDAARPAEGSNPSGSKVLIYQRGSTLEIPEGASILPYYDDKWVAVRVDLKQDQKV